MPKKSGPVRYEQWLSALSMPLSADSVAYMLRGKCNKNLYSAVFNKLSDCITESFNEAQKALSTTDSPADTVFALKRLNAAYKRLLFFREISWIKAEDKKALLCSLGTAAISTVTKLQPIAERNPDVLFECMTLTRTANGDTNE